MPATRQRLGELLIAHRILTPEQLEQALTLQRERCQLLGHVLIQQGWISEDRLLQACAHQQGVTPWSLVRHPPTAEALALVPSHLCRKYHMLPVAVRDGRLFLAMRDPGDVDASDLVRNLCKMRVEPVLANEERLLQAVEDNFGSQPVAAHRESLSRLVSEAMGEFGDPETAGADGAVTEAEMRPVVGLVNQIISDAIQTRASDIHIEPRKDRIEIRYRVDGRLHRAHEIPIKLKAALIARIKIMAGIDIVEYRIPQDGRLSVTSEGRQVDLRLSVLPGSHGQRIVMRVLDTSITLRGLDELGFSARNMALFQDMIHKPYGLVLVTGPTGSGKTTTLYAALNQLKTGANNIMTCEDPVEYDIDGINQSHVNEKVGLTFAAQLRAMLRQDPDIVLVGEIRDKETAETAIRAALTGHLVLSTLHCNDAASAVPRLVDMGIEPFLLSTALIGVAAQRLIRVLCPHCKAQAEPTAEERALLGPGRVTEDTGLWRATGCPQCSHTGYHGRMGVHEVFPVTPELQHSIAACEPPETLRRLAAQYGYRPMQADACDRVLDGQTALDEAQRLVFFDTLAPAAPQPALRAA